MRSVLIAILLPISAPAAAEWVRIGETDEVTVYYDPATVKANGRLRSVRTLDNFKQPRSRDGAMSSDGHLEVDCEGNFRGTFFYYPEPMAGGSAISSFERSKWHYIPCCTVLATLHEMLCR